MCYVIQDACPLNCEGIEIGDGATSGCSCKGNGSPCDCPNHVVKTIDKLGCDEIYKGPSYPQFHGTKCAARYHENPEELHYALISINGTNDYISWYSAAQKERRSVRG